MFELALLFWKFTLPKSESGDDSRFPGVARGAISTLTVKGTRFWSGLFGEDFRLFANLLILIL